MGSREARALAVAAEASLSAGRLHTAQGLAERSRHLARRHRDSRVELSALMTLGKAAERRGDPSVAYRHLLGAERCVERLRRGITAAASVELIRRIDWNMALNTFVPPAGVIAAK